MVQHLLLAMVAAPLIALSAPITLVLRLVSPATRRRWILPVLHSRVTRILAFPVVAWVIFASVMWVSHFSPLFDAALEDPLVHDLEHALFLGAGLLFWWPAVALDPAPWRMPHPARALYVFLQMPQNTFLAVVLLNAQAALYPHYATLVRTWGPTPLADQQAAAGIMWLVGDAIFLVAVMAIVVGWMRAEARDTRAARPAGGSRDGRHPDPRGAAGRSTRARARGGSTGERRLQVSAVLRRIDVAAADDADHRPIEVAQAQLVAAERDRREGQGAARLRDQARPFRGQPDRGGDLGLAHGHDPVEVRAQVREGPSPERLRPRAIGDRPRHVRRGPTDDLPTLERLARIGGELGFHADDPRSRDERLDRHGDTTRESTAADRHEDQRDIRQFLGDLESDRALPGDDAVVVVGRDDGETPFRGDRLGPFAAFFRGRPHGDDLGSVGGDALALDRRGRRWA